MNILHVSSAMTWRGGEQQIEYLIRELQKLGVQNHLSTPYMSALSDSGLEDHAYIHTYKKRSSFNPFIGFHIHNIVKNHHIDIVHVHDSHSHNYAITAAVIGMSSPIILSRRLDFLPTSKMKYNHASISSILCVSDHVKEVMLNIIDNPEKLKTVHDGIDLNKKSPAKYEIKSKYHIPEHATIIANTSAMADHKDYPTFLRTASELLKNTARDLYFLIIGGDAGSRSSIELMIDELGIREKVILTGFVPQAHKLLNEVDVFLFTSKEEGLGSAILEAMLYEVPIVSTEVGGVREIVTDSVNGFLCPIGDHICLASKVLSLLNNKSRRQEIINEGSNFVKKFSSVAMAEKTLAIYQEVLNSVIN